MQGVRLAIFKFLTKCSILISRKCWGLTGVDWEDTQAGRFCWCWNRTEHRTGSNFVYLIILSLSSLAWAGDVENKKMSSHDRSSRWYGVNWVMVHTEYRIHHNNIKSTLHLTTMCHHLALYNLAWANLDKPSLHITGSDGDGGSTFWDKNQTISPMSNLLVG